MKTYLALSHSDGLLGPEGKMGDVQLQILSDLHLETPSGRPSYDHFDIEPNCACLALLGDVGNVLHDELFHFFRRQLSKFDIVFFVLGNREAYGTSLPEARARLKAFEEENDANQDNSRGPCGLFVYMDRTRYDLTDKVTILGCTLFSSITAEQHVTATKFVADFSRIVDWTTESHKMAHQQDLQWLNQQVVNIRRTEPSRTIVILTHHSPTLLKEANDPNQLHDKIETNSASSTDLSLQMCWISPQVKLWAFGHTHFNCDIKDPLTGKRIVSNQRGYDGAEKAGFDASKVVDVHGPPPSKPKASSARRRRRKVDGNDSVHSGESKQCRMS